MQIRDVTTDDIDDVLELNEASVPHVSSIDREQMAWFARHAQYFRVALLNNRLAGFLIGLRPGLDYGSPNYRWFSEHYENFAYIDRVAVAGHSRRRQVASLLYADFADRMGGSTDVLTCEVNIRPPNESSMVFHQRQGFAQVGSQVTEGGLKKVALMEKRL